MLREIFYYGKMYTNKLNALGLLTKKEELGIREPKEHKKVIWALYVYKMLQRLTINSETFTILKKDSSVGKSIYKHLTI